MTMEDRVTQLEEQTAALSVQTLADEAPSGYYTSRYSGEQIDNLLSGLGFEIGGSYANLAAIQAAFPNGDTHAYQAKDTMDIYVWNTETRAWESVGKLQGPVGPKGDKGDPGGPPGPQGISTHAPTPGATAKTTKKQGCFHKKQTIFTSIILCLFLVVKCSMRFLENHLKNLVRGCRTFLFA